MPKARFIKRKEVYLAHGLESESPMTWHLLLLGHPGLYYITVVALMMEVWGRGRSHGETGSQRAGKGLNF